jgi:hypothetical protein
VLQQKRDQQDDNNTNDINNSIAISPLNDKTSNNNDQYQQLKQDYEE